MKDEPLSAALITMHEVNEDIRVYSIESAYRIIGAILLAVVAPFLALYILFSLPSLRYDLAVFLVFTVLVSILVTRRNYLRIDRANMTITEGWRVFFIGRSRTSSLRDFQALAVTRKVVPLEDGYMNIEYAITLSGAAASLELFTEPIFDDASRRRDELWEFIYSNV
ncbi:MAG: hypothetical protein AB1442_11430 [Nitrospirota bacterium]